MDPMLKKVIKSKYSSDVADAMEIWLDRATRDAWVAKVAKHEDIKQLSDHDQQVFHNLVAVGHWALNYADFGEASFRTRLNILLSMLPPRYPAHGDDEEDLLEKFLR